MCVRHHRTKFGENQHGMPGTECSKQCEIEDNDRMIMHENKMIDDDDNDDE